MDKTRIISELAEYDAFPPNSAERTIKSRLRDAVSVKDFGAIGDGVADDTTAFQSVLNLSGNVTCLVPAGIYNLLTSPAAGSSTIAWSFARGAQLTGPGVLPFTPQKVQLGGQPVAATTPTSLLIQGTASAPRTDLEKKTPTLYIERHTNSNPATDTSDWGNPRNSSPVEIENIVYGNDTCSQHTIIGRVFSAAAKAVGSVFQSLVSASFLAQSNAPAGSDNRDCWAMNLVVASSSGNAPTNLVGVEVDVITTAPMPLIRPGVPGAINATAYWAQRDGSSNANTAYYASSSDVTLGWLYGAVFDAPFYDYIAYYRNTLNAPSAKGLRIETQWQANDGRILECFAGSAQEQFRVDGDSDNPVHIRVSSSLRNVTVGPIDSGGVGFRALIVPN